MLAGVCRRRLLEGLDLVSTTLGLLINLAEQDKACQPVLAGLALPHGKGMVPLLCRLMQVPYSPSPELAIASRNVRQHETEPARIVSCSSASMRTVTLCTHFSHATC